MLQSGLGLYHILSDLGSRCKVSTLTLASQHGVLFVPSPFQPTSTPQISLWALSANRSQTHCSCVQTSKSLVSAYSTTAAKNSLSKTVRKCRNHFQTQHNYYSTFYEKSQVFFYKHTFCTLTAVHYNDIRQHQKAHHSLQPFPAKSDVPLSLLMAIPHKDCATDASSNFSSDETKSGVNTCCIHEHFCEI